MGPYYVLKTWEQRPSDPSASVVARQTMRARTYGSDALSRAEESGYIMCFDAAADGRLVLVHEDLPDILGGTCNGFWKVFQRRHRLKFASRSSESRAFYRRASRIARLLGIRSRDRRDETTQIARAGAATPAYPALVRARVAQPIFAPGFFTPDLSKRDAIAAGDRRASAFKKFVGALEPLVS